MNWYCIHTRPKKEQQIAAHLSDSIGLETYYPRLRQYRTIRRVRKLVTSPLFPRYFFCRFDAAINFRAVRYAPDVIDVVRTGAVPSIVDDSLIDELRRWAGDAGDVITMTSPLRAGDNVEITSGPLRGLSAVILRTSDDRDRVGILLSLLNADAQMSISRSLLRRVE